MYEWPLNSSLFPPLCLQFLQLTLCSIRLRLRLPESSQDRPLNNVHKVVCSLECAVWSMQPGVYRLLNSGVQSARAAGTCVIWFIVIFWQSAHSSPQLMVGSPAERDRQIDKLDGVGPLITNPPPTIFTTLSKKRKKEKKKKKIYIDTWQVTLDMWQGTCDTWHGTCDMWHGTCDTWKEVNILSKFQVPTL